MLGFPIAVIVQARSTFVKSEAILCIVETEEKSQEDKVLTASKTMWMQDLAILKLFDHTKRE